MAAIDWPSTLPNELIGSFSENVISPYIEDDAQVGAPRRRKRFTRSLNTFGFTLRMTDTQAAAFRTFRDTTTDGCVKEFNWVHPVTAEQYEVRFKEPPVIRHVVFDVWDTDVELVEI